MTTQRVHWVLPDLGMMRRPEAEQLSAIIAGFQSEGVTRLVSLLEAKEVDMLGLSGEALACKAAGIRFEHMPVPDYGTPADPIAFRTLVRVISGELDDGGRVIVHCRGGIGRSTLLTASVLLERGYALDDALVLVAEARGQRGPETGEQVAWLERWAERLAAEGPPDDQHPNSGSA